MRLTRSPLTCVFERHSGDDAVVGHENLADVAMPNKAIYWAEAPSDTASDHLS